ncbi:MAG: hypothetical protein KJI70_00790, partial [Patescibacteria group bacterium]|nr:hypothetical protein [Patescibacteria group bacterium]
MKSGTIVLLLTTMMIFVLIQDTSHQAEIAIAKESVVVDYRAKSVVAEESIVAVSRAFSDFDVEIEWSNTWGGQKYDHGYSIWSNGTYLYTLGDTDSLGAGSYDFALLKWDTDGNILWNRTWGGSENDKGYSIWSNGTYLYTLGDTRSFGAGSSDFALLKWDTDGNILWNRTWGGQGYDQGRSIWGDGTYLYTLGNAERVTGSYHTYSDLALVKWDTDGNILWNRTWGGTVHDHGYSIWSNGTYLYTLGDTRNYGAGDYDFALLKWDTDGNIVWNRTWSGQGYDRGYSIWGDGTYLYALGYTRSFGASYDVALLKWRADMTVPELNNPSDITYSEESTGHRITWTVIEYNPDRYVVYKDGTEIVSGTWISGSSIVINVDGLLVGSYEYVVVVYDTSNNSDEDTVIVTVVDTTAPVLTSPSDITYEQGEVGNNITWTIADSYPDTYIIYKDDTEIASGVWVSGDVMTVNVDGLLPGLYDYTIVVFDFYGNLARDTVIVVVVDNIVPVLTTLADIVYEQGEVGNNIIWTASDANPDRYVVYKDGTEIVSGTWISGSSI